MKKTLLLIALMLFSAVCSMATQITVSASSLTNYTYGGSTATIRIYPNKTFVTSTGSTVIAGTATGFYKTVNCSVSGLTATCDSFVIDSTTDSNVPTVKYFADLYDSTGRSRGRLVDAFSVPTSLGTTITWEQIRIYNQIATVALPVTFPTSDEVSALISTKQNVLVSGVTIKTVNGNSLLGSGNVSIIGAAEKRLTEYANLATAISTIGSTPTTLNLDTAATCSTALTIPATLLIKQNQNETITESGTCTIAFQGIGLLNAESKIALFTGFEAGDITWTGSDYPSTITTSLWSDSDLSDKLLRAIAAVNGKKVTIKAFPGNFGSQWTLRDGQSLYLTRGTYTNTIDAPDATHFSLESNTVVYGDGMGLTKIQESSALTRNVRLFRTSGSTSDAFENIEIRDLEIDGHANQTWFDNGPASILLVNCNNCHARRIKIKDTHAYGIFVGGFPDLGNKPKESSITDCYFDHVIAQNSGALNGRNIRIERNTYYNMQTSASDPITNAIDIEPNSDDETVENIIVRDNLIDARGAQQVLNGIVVQSGGSKNGIASGEISGNRIIGYDISSFSTSRNLLNGITIAGAYGLNVSGNTIQGALQSGIYLTNSRALNVHSNTILDVGANTTIFGIRVESIADSNFYGNTVEKRTSGFGGTDDTITEVGTTQPATATGSTVTTQSWVYPQWKGLTVTLNATDYTVNSVTNYTTFTTTVAVGTVSNVTVASATDIDAGTDTITANAHGYNENALVKIISSGSIPAGLTNGGSYYIKNKTANTFQLSLTAGGAAVDITSTGTGNQQFQPMLASKFGNNSYAMNKRGSIVLLNGSVEYSKMTDQVVTLGDSQTLTNKTLTSPVLTTPNIGAATATSVNIGTGTTITKVISNTATLDFDLSAVASQDLTISVTGAASGDVCSVGVPNGSVTADTLFWCWISAADTATVRAMRTAGTPNPASGTFRVQVTKF